MTREEPIMWLEGISTREFGWDEYAMQESQREIRERCEDCVREALRMAKEALSAPQTDLIRRADAIDAVAEEWLSEASAESPYVNDDDIGEYRKLAEELFEDVPSADAVQGWIPCSERLPKEKQEVYVTVYFIEGDTGRAYGYMDGFGKWHLCSTVEGTLNSGYEVLAWMPLPTPYKGGDTE